MPYLGFTIRDEVTGARLGAALGDELIVRVARRPAPLPPVVEAPWPSVRADDPRRFFRTTRNLHGDIIVIHVPPGIYRAEIRARGYVTRSARVRSPQREPVGVRLQRDATYAFAPGDTLLEGAVVTASGAPHTGFSVQLLDPDPAVPRRRVRLDARGHYVFYIPEKRRAGAVTLRVLHACGAVLAAVPDVRPHHANVAPLITVL